MSEKIEQTEPLIILSNPSEQFSPLFQSQKHQSSSKNLATQLQLSLAHFSYQKSNKNDQINQQIMAEQEPTKIWTFQEEKILVKLHNLKGNRWVQISLILNQLYLYNRRSDNSVKNHFHSKLRRGARKINSYIEEEQNDCFKIIRNSFLAKIVQSSEGVTVNNLSEKTQRAVVAYEIKNFILSASEFDENKFTQEDKECFKITLYKIKEFQALFKAKPKFTKIEGGIRYKGKEIKTLIKENQIKQKQKIEKRQIFMEATKQQTDNSFMYPQQIQNLQGNIYQQMPLYYIFGQQQMSYPFYNMPLINYPTFTSLQTPSPFFPIQDYPIQSTLSSYIPQNIIQEDDSRGSVLNN